MCVGRTEQVTVSFMPTESRRTRGGAIRGVAFCLARTSAIAAASHVTLKFFGQLLTSVEMLQALQVVGTIRDISAVLWASSLWKPLPADGGLWLQLTFTGIFTNKGRDKRQETLFLFISA